MSQSVGGLADRVQRVRDVSRRPATLGQALPEDVVSLAMGEPDEPTPEPVRRALVDALEQGRTRYAAATGDPVLRQAIADRLTASRGAAVSPASVVITHGGSAGLAAAILATVNPGDRVLLPEPTYSLYADHVALAGGIVEWVPLGADFSLDLREIEARAPQASMIVVCSPGNPTGAVLDQSEVDALVAVCERFGLMCLVDEAYSDIYFDDARPPGTAIDAAARTERVIVSRTFSKSYAMTGWRLGYVVAAPAIADAVNLVHRTFNGPVNSFVQAAGVHALDLPESLVAELRGHYRRRRDLVMSALSGHSAIDVVAPRGAFYAFPRIASRHTSEELVGIFADHGVLLRAGSEYGPSGEGHVRLSFALDTEPLQRGLDRLIAALETLAR